MSLTQKLESQKSGNMGVEISGRIKHRKRYRLELKSGIMVWRDESWRSWFRMLKLSLGRATCLNRVKNDTNWLVKNNNSSHWKIRKKYIAECLASWEILAIFRDNESSKMEATRTDEKDGLLTILDELSKGSKFLWTIFILTLTPTIFNGMHSMSYTFTTEVCTSMESIKIINSNEFQLKKFFNKLFHFMINSFLPIKWRIFRKLRKIFARFLEKEKNHEK